MTIDSSGSVTLIAPDKPLCSMCCKRVHSAVSFLAVSTQHGATYKAVGKRGVSRKIRLCRPCVRELGKAFKGTP